MVDERDLLVEADALLEKGDPRGELIIVQCEIERGGYDRARGIALRKRARELMWTPADDLVREPIVRRGVVAGGTVDANAFPRLEAEITARYPYFTHVKLRGLESESGHVAYSPPRDVDIDTICTMLERVLASGRITSIDLGELRVMWALTYGGRQISEHVDVTNEVVAWLAASGHLGKLSALFINHADEKTVATLLAQPTSFRELGISNSWLKKPALDAIAATSQRPKKLVFDATWPDEVNGLEAMFRAPFFSEVADLTIQYPASFLWNRPLPALRVLRFRTSTGIAPEHLASPLGRQLEELVMGDGDGAAQAIRQRDWDGVLPAWIRE